MKKYADIIFQDNKFAITGDLDFFNVMSVYEKSLAQLHKEKSWHFDFSGLKSCDSSGIALMIEWIKLAKKQSKSIEFSHLSPEILSTAKAAQLDNLI